MLDVIVMFLLTHDDPFRKGCSLSVAAEFD